MALIVGKEHPRLVQSDEFGQTARILRKKREAEIEENARKAAERQRRLDEEAAKKKSDFEAARAAEKHAKEPTEKPTEAPAEETDGHIEDGAKPDGTEPAEDKPIQSSSIIDGSQIKLPPKKKVVRKPKTKK